MFSYILRFIDIQMMYSIYFLKVWGSSASGLYILIKHELAYNSQYPTHWHF